MNKREVMICIALSIASLIGTGMIIIGVVALADKVQQSRQTFVLGPHSIPIHSDSAVVYQAFGASQFEQSTTNSDGDKRKFVYYVRQFDGVCYGITFRFNEENELTWWEVETRSMEICRIEEAKAAIRQDPRTSR